MAGVTRFSACLTCEVRPTDGAGRPVEGQLLMVTRPTELGTAAVVLSAEEPAPETGRSFLLNGSPESVAAEGRLCGDLPEGLGVHYNHGDDDIDGRIERSRAAQQKNCRLAALLVTSQQLPTAAALLTQNA